MTSKSSVLCSDDHLLVAVAVQVVAQSLHHGNAVYAAVRPNELSVAIEKHNTDTVVLETSYINRARLSLIKDIHIYHSNFAMIIVTSL